MTYRTYQIRVKKGHRLYFYLQNLSVGSKDLYNVTNFHLRQIYTRWNLKNPLPLQQEVWGKVVKFLPIMNEKQQNAHEKRLSKGKQSKLNLFSLPSEDDRFVSYNFLDSLFKTSKEPAYVRLPIHTSQHVMKQLYADWKSFFEGLKIYKHSPEKFTGKPKIPQYKKKDKMTTFLSNQECVVKGNYLKFPHTKNKLNLGKLVSLSQGEHKQTRVIPHKDYYIVEVVFAVETKEVQPVKPSRVMSIDLGVDNLATLVSNTGMRPIVYKGKTVKSINQFYNKLRSRYYGILRNGQQPKQGIFSSHKLRKFDDIRLKKMKDYFHKTTKDIVQRAKKHNIDTIFVGYNQGWKSEVEMRKSDKQTFIQIPYGLLINILTYKSNTEGIQVVLKEESYTSKASFLDGDEIPVYGEENGKPLFSGRRIKRSWYRTRQGILFHADVNAAYNIMRKAVPGCVPKGIEGLDGNQSINVSTPLGLSFH